MSDLEQIEITVLKPEENPVIKDAPPAVNVNIGTLNIFLTPAKVAWQGAKLIARPLHRHYQKKYQPHYRHSKKLFLLDIILIIIIGALLVFSGYDLFFKRLPPDKILVGIKASPEDVKSGEEVSFIVDYVNNEEVALTDAKLSFQLPPHFYARLFFPPLDRQSQFFNIGTVEPGAQGQLKITGRVLGGLRDRQRIYANLIYNLSGQNRAGQKNFFLDYNLGGSLLKTKIELPPEVKINGSLVFNVDLTNNSFDEFKNIILLPHWPANFKLVKSEPAISGDRWLVPGLGQGSSSSFKIEGLFLPLGNRPQEPLCFTSFIKENNSTLKQSEVCQPVNTEPIIISFSQQANGQTDNAANLGEELNYVINYKNETADNLKNVVIAAALSGETFDLRTLQVTGGQAQGDQAVWDKMEILRPGQSGELKFSVKLKKAIGKPLDELTAVIQPRADYTILAEPNQVVWLELKIKINAKLSLEAMARYYSPEGEQLGVGPLPPKVGAVTKYWIFFQPKNNFNAFKNVKAIADLPANVKWTGEITASLGKINYNQLSREISWQIDELKPRTADGYQVASAGFAVELTPMANQVGQPAILLKNIKISGQDETTGEIVNFQAPDIDTSLEQDSQAIGQGVVAE